jgi:hypothetical protein
MPIKGKTDVDSVQSSFGRLGQIRKGERLKDGTLVDLDYFRFRPAEGPYKEQLMAIWLANYGEKPTSIEVFLPRETVEQNFKTWKESYGTTGLKFRCDGEYWVMWRDENLKYIKDYQLRQKKVCPYCSGEIERTDKDPGDRDQGYLDVVLMPFVEAGLMGTFTLHVTSEHDIPTINNRLYATYEEAVKHNTSLRGIPFQLMRVKRTIQARYKNKEGVYIKTPQEKSLIEIMPSPMWAKIAIDAAKRNAMLQQSQPMMLPQDQDFDDSIPIEHVIGQVVEEAPVQTKSKTESGEKQTEIEQREPMAPHEVIGIVREHAERLRGSNFEYTEDKRSKAEWKIKKNLEVVFPDQDDFYNALYVLTGTNDRELMDDAVIEALSKYLKVTKVDEGWVLDPAICQELKALVEAEKEKASPSSMPSIFEDITKYSLAKKRKYASKLFNACKDNGLEVSTYTDKTMDDWLTVAEDLLKQAGVG